MRTIAILAVLSCSVWPQSTSVMLVTGAPAQRSATPAAPDTWGDRASASRCREAMEHALHDGATMYRVGLCFEAVRDFSDAANVYREAANAGFQPATSTARLASIFLVTGQKERALAEMRRSLAQDCTAPQMHQLDFWIGEWELRSNGHATGTSTVEPAPGGCALIRKLSSDEAAGNLTVLFYDPVTKKWHEEGTGSKGEIWEASGEFREGAMHFSGARPIPHRCTISAVRPIEVRETTETPVDDEGLSWTALHDLIYIRRE